ncbi:MAG: hypothetical protein OEZ39_19350 [Gammaproteobacteria bacterium]|nr:hypothetical protein [Gammaproteobacteria bacterium]MDH5654022.1 hypothetical protein [Gammaproteobacteria bacterium]
MKKILQDIIVTLFGALASLLTAGILYVVEEQLEFSFYSLMLLFIIPVGAILSGFVAAGGYYVGARLFGHKPGKLLLFNMVAVSIGTFFIIYYLSYLFTQVEGVSISKLVPFTTYMDTILQHQSIQFSVHGADVGGTGELGLWGYATAALQILGFAIGGFFVYAILAALPYCDKCQKYLKQKAKQVRYTSDTDGLAGLIETMQGEFAAGTMQQAVDTHARFGAAQHQQKEQLQSTLTHKCCPGCAINWLEFTVYKLGNSEWEALNEYKLAGFSAAPLKLAD